MPYAQLPLDFDEAPRNVDLELDELGFLACALSYAARNLTDGFIPDRAIRAFGKSGRAPRLVARLVAKDALQVVPGGVLIARYFDRDAWDQPKRDDVLAKREGARARKAEQRKREVGAAVTQPVTRDIPRDSRAPSRDYSTALHSTALHSTHGTRGAVPRSPDSSVPSAVAAEAPRGVERNHFNESWPDWIKVWELAVRHLSGNKDWAFPSGDVNRREELYGLLHTYCLPPARGDVPRWIVTQLEGLSAHVASLKPEDRRFWPLMPKSVGRWINECRPAPKPAKRAPVAAYHKLLDDDGPAPRPRPMPAHLRPPVGSAAYVAPPATVGGDLKPVGGGA